MPRWLPGFEGRPNLADQAIHKNQLLGNLAGQPVCGVMVMSDIMFRTHTETLHFMASQQPRNDADWPKVVLRRADQAVAAAVTAISLLAIASWYLWQAVWSTGVLASP